MKKKILCCALASAGLIAAVCVIIFVFSKKNIEAEAGATLPGVESIVDLNSGSNPYTIIEVVANKNDAMVGWFVGGEEPLMNGKSFKDMPDVAERNAAMSGYSVGAWSSLNGAVIYDTAYDPAGTYTSYEVRGYVVDDSDGDYVYSATSVSYRDYVTGDDDDKRYTPYIDFIGGNSVALNFGPLNTLADLNIMYGGNTYAQYYRYDITDTLLSDLNTSDWDTVANSNAAIYTKSANGALFDYYYLGTITKYDLDGDGTDDIAYEDILGNYSDGTTYFSDTSSCVISLSRTTVGGDYVVTSINDMAGIVNGCASVGFEYVKDPAGPLVAEIIASALQYTPGAGDKTFVASSTGQLYGTASFSGGFINNDFFKHYVFDVDDPETFTLDVKVVTMDEFAALDLSAVNMVVLRAGSYSVDMGKVQAQSLLKEVVENKLPVLMELGFDSNSSLTYNHRMAILLRNRIKTVSNLDLDTGFDWNTKATSMLNPSSIMVNGNVILSKDNYFGGDFRNAVDASLYNSESAPLYPVYAEIISENFYRNNAGKGSLPNAVVSKATVIRYIVNYTNQRIVTKPKITVLEIEPCYSFGNYSITELSKVYNPATGRTVTISNTNPNASNYFRHVLSQSYIATNWATQFVGKENDITLVQTYTKEFDGKVEDLNENYDLIYIGTDTSTMNTSISGGIKSTTATLYNDGNMNGLIYSHVGDIIHDTSASRILGFEISHTQRLYWPDKYSEIYDNRLSGNDITASKLSELKQYIDAGYPIVFADNFYDRPTGVVTKVNDVAIDINSNMYKLAEYAMGRIGQNVFLESEISGDVDVQKRLSNCINISKLKVELTKQPQEYTYNSGNPRFLPMKNGHYTLEYIFSLKNDAAVGIGETKYDVELFIDTSVDGRYTEAEKIPSLTVEVLGGDNTYTRLRHNSEGKYELIAGKTYRLTRVVPNGYTGILPWKLLFTQNDNSLVRKAVMGYTAIPINPAERKDIKVLQITSAQGDNNLDLKNSNVQALFDEIEDFNILVTPITSQAFINQYGSSEAYALTYLKSFDMVIVGFTDMYQFGHNVNETYSANAATALSKYIEDGRSVLFTHDTTSFYNRSASFIEGLLGIFADLFNMPNFNRFWGYNFNTYVRNTVGMDRFGATSASGVHDTYAVKKSESIALTQGYSDFILNRFNKDDDTYRASTRAIYADSSESVRGGTLSGQYKATALNDGQIRHYPFDIPETITVANTHGQYYQLNLDTDPTDEVVNDDIVVWYTLSDIVDQADDIYQANPKDARNNYYIYNRGNVTYSGVGHSAVNTDPRYDITELKLFINTIVASYSAGVHPPTVTYLSGETGALIIDNTYIPFDNASGTVISTNDIEMYFEIADTSFVQGTRELEVKYYIEDSSGADSIDYVNGDEVETVKVREITPGSASVKLEKGDTEVTGTEIHSPELDTRYTLSLPITTVSSGNRNITRVFISAETKYTLANGRELSSGVGYYSMNIVRTDLFDLD